MHVQQVEINLFLMYSRCAHWLKGIILDQRTEREMENRRNDTHVLILLWLINFQMWWLWNRQTKHRALCRAAVAFGWTCKFVFIVVFEASTSLCLSPFGDLRRSRSASGACFAFSVTVSPEWKQVSGDVVQASADFFLFLYLFIYFFTSILNTVLSNWVVPPTGAFCWVADSSWDVKGKAWRAVDRHTYSRQH